MYFLHRHFIFDVQVLQRVALHQNYICKIMLVICYVRYGSPWKPNHPNGQCLTQGPGPTPATADLHPDWTQRSLAKPAPTGTTLPGRVERIRRLPPLSHRQNQGHCLKVKTDAPTAPWLTDGAPSNKIGRDAALVYCLTENCPGCRCIRQTTSRIGPPSTCIPAIWSQTGSISLNAKKVGSPLVGGQGLRGSDRNQSAEPTQRRLTPIRRLRLKALQCV